MDEKKQKSVLDTILDKSIDELIPWEEVTLPSLGVFYSGKIPGGVVKVRGMGLYADKVLANQRLAQSGQSINWLLKQCVQWPEGFTSEDLLLGDQNALLYIIRGITHGNIYEFAITCGKCNSPSTHEYDLNDLYATKKGPTFEDEPFKLELPYISKKVDMAVTVGIKLLRVSDVHAIINNKKLLKRGGIKSDDTSVEKNLSAVIVDVNGDVNRFKIDKFIEKLHSSDTSLIRQWLDDNSPGIDTKIDIVCPDCDHEMRVDLPITESFFRSKK